MRGRVVQSGISYGIMQGVDSQHVFRGSFLPSSDVSSSGEAGLLLPSCSLYLEEGVKGRKMYLMDKFE